MPSTDDGFEMPFRCASADAMRRIGYGVTCKIWSPLNQYQQQGCWILLLLRRPKAVMRLGLAWSKLDAFIRKEEEEEKASFVLAGYLYSISY